MLDTQVALSGHQDGTGQMRDVEVADSQVMRISFIRLWTHPQNYGCFPRLITNLSLWEVINEKLVPWRSIAMMLPRKLGSSVTERQVMSNVRF
jgi:hypothetical protein